MTVQTASSLARPRLAASTNSTENSSGRDLSRTSPTKASTRSRFRALPNTTASLARTSSAVTPKLNLVVGGRYNLAQINLSDLLGGPVNGNNTFAHFNPSVGLTYQLLPWLQAYGNWAVTNRAPTPQELSCSSAAAPCSLLNFFVGDPPLQQVVANTFEIRSARRQVRQASGTALGVGTPMLITRPTTTISSLKRRLITPTSPIYVNAGKTLREGCRVQLAL